jgi:hypothetical protein
MNSKEGKALRKVSLRSKKHEITIPPRPQINPNVEGILKGELVELLSVDRTKLLTSEQEKVMWKKEEKMRQAERQVAHIIEKQAEQQSLQRAQDLLQQKPTERVDTVDLPRPLGYGDLEVPVAGDAMTFEAETQVDNRETDREYALERGADLTDDDILWPTTATFNIEMGQTKLLTSGQEHVMWKKEEQIQQAERQVPRIIEKQAEQQSLQGAQDLQRKPSERVDAMTLTRPVGYKDLELSVAGDAMTFEAETQVTSREIDREYALERGIELTDDDILWPTIATFNIEMAAKRIQDYISQCWTIDPKWMFDIKPIQTITDDYRKRYVFEVKFSVPTTLHPIPQATASVFFIMESSHYAPKDDMIKVHYVVEGTRFLHAPATLPFQDKWLWSIISDKIRIQRSIEF